MTFDIPAYNSKTKMLHMGHTAFSDYFCINEAIGITINQVLGTINFENWYPVYRRPFWLYANYTYFDF